MDVVTPLYMEMMIDNNLMSARVGQEAEFVRAVRIVLERIRMANLLTSPGREDKELLRESSRTCVFLGEEYAWIGRQRLVQNSIKNLTKLDFATEAERFTMLSFAALVSLICSAQHATQLSPANVFLLIGCYRALYRKVMRERR